MDMTVDDVDCLSILASVGLGVGGQSVADLYGEGYSLSAVIDGVA
jgi:hypothetical protein